MNSIFIRRSVRQFENRPVEKEKTEKLLRAAMQAPSAGNGQPWEFIVVEGKENLEKLSKLSPYAGCIVNSSLAIIVLGNKKRIKLPENWEQDLGAVTQNILLEAVELGLGGVWLGVAPVTDRMNYICNLYGLTHDILPYSVIALGYPKKKDANVFVDRYDESRIKYIGR